MSEKTLAKLLAEASIRYEPSVIEGKKDLYKTAIYNPDGHFLGTFDAAEAFEFLEKFNSGEIE